MTAIYESILYGFWRQYFLRPAVSAGTPRARRPPRAPPRPGRPAPLASDDQWSLCADPNGRSCIKAVDDKRSWRIRAPVSQPFSLRYCRLFVRRCHQPQSDPSPGVCRRAPQQRAASPPAATLQRRCYSIQRLCAGFDECMHVFVRRAERSDSSQRLS
jgi:hypothetical protein